MSSQKSCLSFTISDLCALRSILRCYL